MDPTPKPSPPPSFFALPRELRDQIYIFLLLPSTSLPSPPAEKFLAHNPVPSTSFLKIYDAPSALRGEFGCAYARSPVPGTCAGFLACCTQANREMREARERLEKKGEVGVRLDCLAVGESWFYFTFLGGGDVCTSLPKTQQRGVIRQPQSLHSNIALFLTSILPWGKVEAIPKQTTHIPRLWVDVRLEGTRRDKHRPTHNPADRISWAVCAALKRLFERGPHLTTSRRTSPISGIHELVLNVEPPPAPATLLPEDFPPDADGEGSVHPRTVARELVGVWGKIWAGEGFKGVLYGGLLERIGWVRVCVEGRTLVVREVRGVLERGSGGEEENCGEGA